MTLSLLHIAYRRPALFAAMAVLLACLPATAARAAELLMVTRPHCPYCKLWEIQVGSIYDRTRESSLAPLQRMKIEDISSSAYVFNEPVLYTPTFILLDENVEVGRIVGYADEAAFWGLFDELLSRLPPSR